MTSETIYTAPTNYNPLSPQGSQSPTMSTLEALLERMATRRVNEKAKELTVAPHGISPVKSLAKGKVRLNADQKGEYLNWQHTYSEMLRNTKAASSYNEYRIRPVLVQLRMELTEKAWEATHGNVKRNHQLR